MRKGKALKKDGVYGNGGGEALLPSWGRTGAIMEVGQEEGICESSW